jgi:hypothetical protein
MLAFPDTLAIGAAVFGVATWVIPWLRYALQSRKPPKTSLASVGHAIGFLVLAGLFSAATLVVAILALLFSSTPNWGWYGLIAVAAYWPLLFTALYIGHRLHRGRTEDPTKRSG